MEKYLKYFLLVVFSCSFGFLLVSDAKQDGTTGIVNYYYFQGKKFFYRERTDVIFLKFSANIPENNAPDPFKIPPDRC